MSATDSRLRCAKICRIVDIFAGILVGLDGRPLELVGCSLGLSALLGLGFDALRGLSSLELQLQALDGSGALGALVVATGATQLEPELEPRPEREPGIRKLFFKTVFRRSASRLLPS